MPSEKRKFGDICENLAKKYLLEKGFKILERNYRKKWGEIDLIASQEDMLHFVEVKGTLFNSKYDHKPEDNVHMWKTRRIWRAIQTWFMDHPDYEDFEWQIDVVAVLLDFDTRKAKIRWTKNIIIEQ
jgi:putative endonuclease